MSMTPQTKQATPILYEGREIYANKEWVAGTHRAMDPALTLERIRPHLAQAGITRVADITGLDNVGVPVVIATRPGSGSLAVEAGKGATLHAAAASATMEAIERFVGEECPVRDVVGTFHELSEELPSGGKHFPLLSRAEVLDHRAYPWSWMWDLMNDRRWLVPESLVELPVVQPRTLSMPWASTSNGLASGNHLAEALCAGLYEVIERDATSCWEVAHSRGEPNLLVDLEGLRGDVIRGLRDQIRGSGSDIAIVWCPTEVGVPTFTAYVWSEGSGIGLYKGYGCHLDPEIAMVRAVTEAVQARTIFVAGARDDLLREAHATLRRSDVGSPRMIVGNSVSVSVDTIPDRSTDSFHGDMAIMIDGLRRSGFDHVLVREFEMGVDFEVSVVRVVVPGLEPYRFPWIAVTERAMNFRPPRDVIERALNVNDEKVPHDEHE